MLDNKIAIVISVTKINGGIMSRKKELSEKLRGFREANDLTQYDMARMLGCSIATYRNWELQIGYPNEAYQEKLKELMRRGE